MTDSSPTEDPGPIDDLFIVDASPGIIKEDLDVPAYEKKFYDVLQVQDSSKINPIKQKSKPPQNICWNCEGNHSLRECTEKRNFEAINRNRAIFMSKQPASRGGKPGRYHQDDQQKFPHNQPGIISSRLQRALGLKPNQLPRHIYQMRSAGYPPGWVEEARVSHSGLYLFNSDGREVADPGFEDGEIVAAGAKDKFDVRKIIEYPGYNCQCGSDVIDETERLNARPMAEIDSIERMISIWQPKAVRAYQRKKMKSEEASGTSPLASAEIKHSPSNTEENGMNSEEDGEICDDQDIESEKAEPVTPKVENLKRPSCSSSDHPEIKKPKLEECIPWSNDSEKIESNVKISDSSSNGGQEVIVTTPQTPSVGRVKSVSLGTPVIVTSQYTNLPTPEKFSKDIQDVINFENLPDSTGKYEKMSGLLKKVRVTVSKMFEDADESDE